MHTIILSEITNHSNFDTFLPKFIVGVAYFFNSEHGVLHLQNYLNRQLFFKTKVH